MQYKPSVGKLTPLSALILNAHYVCGHTPAAVSQSRGCPSQHWQMALWCLKPSAPQSVLSVTSLSFASLFMGSFLFFVLDLAQIVIECRK